MSEAATTMQDVPRPTHTWSITVQTAPNDPTLQPLFRERQFLAAVIVGLPLLVYAYVQVALAILHQHGIDVVSVGGALTANPITVYLVARQYPRGKASEAVGAMMAAAPLPAFDGDPADQAEAADALHAAQVATVMRDDTRMVMTGHTDDGRLQFTPAPLIDPDALAAYAAEPAGVTGQANSIARCGIVSDTSPGGCLLTAGHDAISDTDPGHTDVLKASAQ